MNLLFVVHRYHPYPGGSEIYVHAMASEALRRGHQVTVLTDAHQGDQDGIRVTGDYRILETPFDLVVIHGANASTQDKVILASRALPSKTLFLIVRPSGTPIERLALSFCSAIGYSTSTDYLRVLAEAPGRPLFRVRHGVDPATSLGRPGFRARADIRTPRLIVSAGGFWPHKGMTELAAAFRDSAIADATLVLFGYAHPELAPAAGDTLRVIHGAPRAEVLDAVHDADLYVMNSREEGFGLVLLEAMLNETPWLARDVGAAPDLAHFGRVYRRDGQLPDLLATPVKDSARLAAARRYVGDHHLIGNTVDDLDTVADALR